MRNLRALAPADRVLLLQGRVVVEPGTFELDAAVLGRAMGGGAS